MQGHRVREPRCRRPACFRQRACGSLTLGLRLPARDIEARGPRVVLFELLEALARSRLVLDDLVEGGPVLASQLAKLRAARLDRL